jgi:hypothetical protein
MDAMKTTENEVFALRDGELLTVFGEEPSEVQDVPSGRWICVMLRSVDFPDGPVCPFRESDKATVECAAVLACQKVRGEWQWIQLGAPSKENIGDLLFDANAERDKWYYLEITQAQ